MRCNGRIDKIEAFSDSAFWFPHDSTLCERFEAYRMLGYQMASTYLEPLAPAAGDDLGWCDFGPAGSRSAEDGPPDG